MPETKEKTCVTQQTIWRRPVGADFKLEFRPNTIPAQNKIKLLEKLC